MEREELITEQETVRPRPGPSLVNHVEHVGLRVPDVGLAREFYVDLLGFVEAERTADRIYLRGIEERYHHCLVLVEAETFGLDHVGYRVSSVEALAPVGRALEEAGCRVEWASDPDPGASRALRTHDPTGLPAEYFWGDDSGQSLLLQSHRWLGIPPVRIDHVHLRLDDPEPAIAFFTEALGCRIRELAHDEHGGRFGVWMSWKPNLHDIALLRERGPSYMHHVGFWVADAHSIIRVGDILADAGFRHCLDRGPGRHGIGNALFFYIKDPFGNRLELYTGDRFIFNPDQPPIVWDWQGMQERGLMTWGPPAPPDWHEPIPSARWWD